MLSAALSKNHGPLSAGESLRQSPESPAPSSCAQEHAPVSLHTEPLPTQDPRQEYVESPSLPELRVNTIALPGVGPSDLPISTPTSSGSSAQSRRSSVGSRTNASTSSSIQSQPGALNPDQSNIRRWHWKAVAAIFGFQLLAFLSALGHYLLFAKLHRARVDTKRFSQPQISSIALLLVTSFKAAVTASVGSCFAQHLWSVLRERETSIRLIEQLFILRNNVLALGSLKPARRAPLLFLMALYIWCVGIAMIYPPGSLTVVSIPHESVEDTEILVVNPSSPRTFDPVNFGQIGLWPSLTRLQSSNGTDSGERETSFDVWFIGPRSALTYIARSVLMGDRMLNPLSYTGENSTYSLGFRAPQVRCSESFNEVTDQTLYNKWEDDDIVRYTVPLFTSLWNRTNNNLTYTKYAVVRAQAPRLGLNVTNNVTLTAHELSCHGQSRQFDLTVSYTRGGIDIKRAPGDMRPLGSVPRIQSHVVNKNLEPMDNSSSWPSDLREWMQDLIQEQIPIFNGISILESLGLWMNTTVLQECVFIGSPTCIGLHNDIPRTSPSADLIKPCEMRCKNMPDNIKTFPLIGTVLHTGRFNDSANNYAEVGSAPDMPNFTLDSEFDLAKDIQISEELLNEILYNITLSSLTLELWKEKVPVTTTSYHNTYRFSHRKNLFLPYSISLGIAIIFGIIAVWSLHQNGVPAADGGFLQVMMATRGDTEMERLVLTDGVKAGGEVSKELGALKVRYGELIDTDGREGFGTVEETVGMRRRKFWGN